MTSTGMSVEEMSKVLTEQGYVVRRASAFPARRAETENLAVQGYSNKEIAHKMGITEATVKAHLKAILAHHGLTNRTQLAYLKLTGKRPPSAGDLQEDGSHAEA